MRFATCCLLFALMVLCRGDQTDDFRIIDSLHPEPECNSAGGMCVIAEDCSGTILGKGLCPKQAYKGVECCNMISRKETRCSRFGGVCMPLDSPCYEKLVETKATDCPNQKCCIMTF